MQYTNLIWRDGQPYSELFDDIYYSPVQDSKDDSEGDADADVYSKLAGAGEFEHVFFKHNGLPDRWQHKSRFVIGELGFGSGLNCLLTMHHWLQGARDHNARLYYIAIERYPLSPESIARLFEGNAGLKVYVDELLRHYPPPIEGTHVRHLFDGRVCIHFKFMDVNDALNPAGNTRGNTRMNVDAWYLDGFAPAKNPAMWSDEVFQGLAKNSHTGTTCSTYTAAGVVKRGLQQAGFTVEKVKGHGKKREMIVARYDGDTSTPTTRKSSYRYADKPWFIQPSRDSDESILSRRATIIGAGVAGLSVAYSLVKRGWDVEVIDRHGEVAKESSANPCGIVYPRLSVNNDIDLDYYMAAFYHSVYELNLLQDSYTSHGGEAFWYESGMLQMIDRKRIDEIIKKYQFNSDYLSVVDVDLDDDEIGDVEIEQHKHLHCPDEDSVFIEHKCAGVVLPDILCKALQQACGDKLKIIHADIDRIERGSDQWLCMSEDVSGDLLDNRQVTTSDVLIIASGVSVDAFGLDLDLPVESIRGQVAALAEVDESSDMTKAVNAGKYFTPLINGRHYIGATYNRGVNDIDVNHEDNASLLKILNSFYPGKFDEDDIVSSWAGFRLMTKDRVPVVGAVPDAAFFKSEYADIRHGNNLKDYAAARYQEGLYVSLAHGSRGFTSSLLSAEVIAAQIEAEPLPVSDAVMNYLSPSRFIVNDLKRG